MTTINKNSTSEIKENSSKDNYVKRDFSLIEKIKEMRLIEEIKEIKNFTDNQDYTKDNVLEAYNELFSKCLTLIRKYIVNPYSNIYNIRDADIYMIGEKNESPDSGIFLHHDGRIVTIDYGQYHYTSNYEEWYDTHKLEDVVDYLYPPQQILYNIYLILRTYFKSNQEK